MGKTPSAENTCFLKRWFNFSEKHFWLKYFGQLHYVVSLVNIKGVYLVVEVGF